MTHGLGTRYFLKSVIFFEVSPFHLKILPSLRIPNTIRRIREEFPYVVPPLAFGWLVYNQTEKLHVKYKRKQPGDYDDEDDDA
ncbi:cytochrome b-c1 complex subunit 8-like [Leptinotarsa decemlineata]|uniref:cytochrome b-c1 complex subunit 8-like n=1 Tax=Leptinotarsa decemlineata TaxID=7539 RepID=UPI003D3068D0